MSETSLDSTGKSVEDAIEKGLAQLGLPREAVKVQVIRAGSRGLLGIGAEDAIVRLTPLKNAGPSVPLKGAGSTTPLKNAGPSVPLKSAGPQVPLGGTGATIPPKSAGSSTPVTSAGAATPLKGAGPSAPLRGAGPATPPETASTTAPHAAGGSGNNVERATAPLADTAADAEEVVGTAKQVLETLLRGMGIRSRVEVQRDVASEDAKAFVLNIIGDDLGILIGRRGETLRDLEYVTRLLVLQKTSKQAKLTVDVEGYRTRRERVLNELAKRMAERVQSNRQPITLEAMPPNERRIVHLALRDHPTVMTQSIGEGDHRRVMIIPK